jgi:hypothetical protein
MPEILPPVIINNNPNLIIPALNEAGNQIGPIFQTGTQGPQGLAATINVGTVTTGEPGSLVIVNNSGTSSVAVFDFTIPRGDVGAEGPKGDTGDAATIDVGTVTTGAAGSDVVITNAGSIHDAILNFTIPRGDKGEKGDKGDTGETGLKGDKGETGLKGDKGDKGDTGDAATIQVDGVYTGEPGTNVIIDVLGDEHDVTLSFTIPRGDTGETGPPGETGGQGSQGRVRTQGRDRPRDQEIHGRRRRGLHGNPL